MSRRSRVTDIETAVAAMSIDNLHCRDYGHSWRPHDVHVLARKQGYVQELLCARCGTSRIRAMDRWGMIIASQYRHADGYLISGLGRLSMEDRGVIRVASVRDALAEIEG
jgi:hypothetical protein